MKLWLLDADVIIDLLSMNVFDNLVKNHEIFCATTVIDEVKGYWVNGEFKRIYFQNDYIDKNRVKEVSATFEDIDGLNRYLPKIKFDSIDKGEKESLAILKKDESLIFCTCDKAAIRILPFLDVLDRGISFEKLLKATGLSRNEYAWKHKEEFFQKYLLEGKTEKIESFSSEDSEK